MTLEEKLTWLEKFKDTSFSVEIVLPKRGLAWTVIVTNTSAKFRWRGTFHTLESGIDAAMTMVGTGGSVLVQATHDVVAPSKCKLRKYTREGAEHSARHRDSILVKAAPCQLCPGYWHVIDLKRCPDGNKVAYQSQGHAENAAVHLPRKYLYGFLIIRGVKKKEAKGFARAYECATCKRWHVTTKEWTPHLADRLPVDISLLEA